MKARLPRLPGIALRAARSRASSRARGVQGALLCGAVALASVAASAQARADDAAKLAEAAAVVQAFSTRAEDGIPAELLARAHGIAVIPNVLRGGFIFGARRGRGALVVRTPGGAWSNPAFITLTGGSIGWQIGAESADVILVFANERSVRNMETGKFTLGGDASAIAGPLGRHTTVAVTFRAEVYSYIRSQGLFAGAVFEGARLAVDHDANWAFYKDAPGAQALEEQDDATPPEARGLLLALEEAALVNAPPDRAPAHEEGEQEALIYPLD